MRWRPQWLVNLNMLSGINCEYHLAVNTGGPPTILSEATLVHGGIRCNRCRTVVDIPKQVGLPPSGVYVPSAVLCPCHLLSCLHARKGRGCL